jgi:uncharacterized protein (UPF0335 family)
MSDEQEPKRDFSKMLDLNRATITKEYVDQYEVAFQQQVSAASDIRQITDDAKEAEFGPREIKAMKRIAKLRLQDKLADAKEDLEALERVGRLVQFDLFDFDERRLDKR